MNFSLNDSVPLGHHDNNISKVKASNPGKSKYDQEPKIFGLGTMCE